MRIQPPTTAKLDFSGTHPYSPLTAYKESSHPFTDMQDSPSTGDLPHFSQTPPTADRSLQAGMLMTSKPSSYLAPHLHKRNTSTPTEFLTLNANPRPQESQASAFLQAKPPLGLESMPFDPWYARNNMPPPPVLASPDQKYQPSTFRHSISGHTPPLPHPPQHSQPSQPYLQEPPHTFLHIPHNAPPLPCSHEASLSSYETREQETYTAEALKIRQKYTLLLTQFSTDTLSDFLFTLTTQLGIQHTKLLTELSTTHDQKLTRFTQVKDQEYKSQTLEEAEKWRARLDTFITDQKREFEKRSDVVMDEFEEKLTKTLKGRKDEARAKFERDLTHVDEKYDDLATRERKRKHLDGVRLVEELEATLTVDMRKVQDTHAAKLVTAEKEYVEKVQALEAKAVADEREYARTLEVRYLKIEKDKHEAFALSNQSTAEKELALQAKRERIRFEEDEVRKLEVQVKGFRHNILLEQRDQIAHETRQLFEPAPRSPKITLNDLSFEVGEIDERVASSDVSLDIADLADDFKSHSILRKSVHMQKLDREFEREETQIIAARNLLESQGQSFCAKQRELDNMQSKWANDMTDIQTLMETDVHTERRSKSPSIVPQPSQRHREPSFPIPQDFKPTDNAHPAYTYQNVLHNKANENVYLADELNPVNAGISKILEMLKESKESLFQDRHVLSQHDHASTHHQSVYPTAEQIVGERRYSSYPLHIPRHTPEIHSIRNISKHNRFVDASANKSEVLLREHQKWFRGFTARNGGFVR